MQIATAKPGPGPWEGPVQEKVLKAYTSLWSKPSGPLVLWPPEKFFGGFWLVEGRKLDLISLAHTDA